MGLSTFNNMQAGSLCSGLEFELQQLNIPLIVEENRYSSVATTDRNRLTLIVEELAKNAVAALKKDSSINKRYATQAFLVNQLKKVKQTSRGKETKLTDEKIKLLLPYTATSWNDLDENDIQIQMYREVVNINELYKWYNVHISFEHFINHRTKLLIDKMDEEDEPVGVNYNYSIIDPVEGNVNAASASLENRFEDTNLRKSVEESCKSLPKNSAKKVANLPTGKTACKMQKNKVGNKVVNKTPRKKSKNMQKNTTKPVDDDSFDCMIVAEIAKQK